MTLPLDELNFDVIAPDDVPLEKLTVIDVGHSLSGQDVDQDHWWRIGLAPADDDSTTAPVVETIARLGVRPVSTSSSESSSPTHRPPVQTRSPPVCGV